MEEKENKQKRIEELQQQIAELENKAQVGSEIFEIVKDDDDSFDALMAEGISLSSDAPDAVSDTEQKDTTADGTNAEGEIQVDIEKLTDKEEEVKKKKRTGNKIHKHIVRNNKRILRELAVAAAILLVLFVAGSKFVALYPYAFTVNDKVICYVNGDKQAEKVRDKLLEDYKVEGTEVRAVDTDGMFKMEKCDEIKVAEKKVMNVEDAVAAISEAAAEVGEEGKDFNITLACTKTETVAYTPEPNYKKDDEMLAGQSEVLVEGVDGTQKVSTTYTTVNGQITEEQVTATEILDKGSKATIKKGTLGLPEGEDWRTYEGDPEFKDGKVMVVYAQQFLGNPYKYGGYDLYNGIDCVQFVRAMYKKYGITLPNNHSGIRKSGVEVSYDNMQAGDVICYTNHMAIYMGDGRIIHATRAKKHCVQIFDNPKYKQIVTIRRILK